MTLEQACSQLLRVVRVTRHKEQAGKIAGNRVDRVLHKADMLSPRKSVLVNKRGSHLRICQEATISSIDSKKELRTHQKISSGLGILRFNRRVGTQASL